MERVNLATYLSNAKTVIVRFDDHVLNASPKKFSTGSVGWYASGKVKILIGDVYYPVQAAVTLTVIGSKNSHAQEGPQEAQEGQDPALLGPDYPWNENTLYGANGEVLEGGGVETASHDGEGKMRQRPKKARKTRK